MKVRAKGQSVYHYTHALLDSGSTKTFCSKALIEKLDVKGEQAKLSLTTVNSSESTDVELVALEVVAAKSRAEKAGVIQLPNVYALPNLPTLENCIASPSDIRKWPHLKDLRLPRVDESGVSILIGQDVPEALWPLELRKGKEGQPYATRTRLGWSLNGPLESDSLAGESAFCNLARADERLDVQVEQFWKLETSEALASSLPQFSVDDKRAVDVWERSVKVVDGHYQMDIPFKSEHSNLPDNRSVAGKRLQSLAKRFLRDPELYTKYKGGIQELLDKGYAERVPEQEIGATPGRTWYLPHHNVVNENKPEKLRIVFDCAATFGGTSLNKEVLQGPDFTNNLVGVLLRFREGPVAVMGDIEGMFHQVWVSPKDRCLVPADFGRLVKCQLHHFCDASLSAYGSVSYLRAVNSEGKIHCTLLLGKSRLAPIRQMTIPRLELSAAVIAVRMDRMLCRELTLEIQESVFWTDSMIVLQYIYSRSKRFQTFVANRLSVIHDGSMPRQWRKVGTKENPADDVSRGLSGLDMISSDRWRQVPVFLWQDESTWPANSTEGPEVACDDQEVKNQVKCCLADVEYDAREVGNHGTSRADGKQEPTDPVTQFLESYSCWHRLKRGMAWLLRFKNWLREKTKVAERVPSVTTNSLDPSELQVVETAIIRFVQQKCFREDVKVLKSRKPVVKKSPIYILEPFLDGEGILQVGGRLKNAPLSETAQHPIILPKNHHVSKLVVRQAHEFQSGR